MKTLARLWNPFRVVVHCLHRSKLRFFPQLSDYTGKGTTKPPTNFIEAPPETCTYLLTSTHLLLTGLWNLIFSAESQLFLTAFQKDGAWQSPLNTDNLWRRGNILNTLNLLTWFCVINYLHRSLSQIYNSVHFKHPQVLFIQGNVTQKGSWNTQTEMVSVREHLINNMKHQSELPGALPASQTE